MKPIRLSAHALSYIDKRRFGRSRRGHTGNPVATGWTGAPGVP